MSANEQNQTRKRRQCESRCGVATAFVLEDLLILSLAEASVNCMYYLTKLMIGFVGLISWGKGWSVFFM